MRKLCLLAILSLFCAESETFAAGRGASLARGIHAASKLEAGTVIAIIVVVVLFNVFCSAISSSTSRPERPTYNPFENEEERRSAQESESSEPVPSKEEGYQEDQLVPVGRAWMGANPK